MSLISTVNLKTILDRFGAARDLYSPIGSREGSPVLGTARDMVNEAFTVVIRDLDDFEQVSDMSQGMNTAVGQTNLEAAYNSWFNSAMSAVEGHISSRGRSVASSIVSLATYLTYYNGGVGGVRFANMMSPQLSDAYFIWRGSRLVKEGIYSPAINPANGAASGMGKRAVGGAFTDGAAVDTTKYSEVNLVAVVTVNFAAGTAPPTLTVNGTDHTGAAMTWTGNLVGNNPAAAVATTTTEVITAWTRQVVTLASAAGIAVGSWLTIDDGTENEETVLVEAVAGADITAVFKKGHGNGAAVIGSTSLLLIPGTAGRRCADATGITIGVTGHSAGEVRIEGVQDRVPL